VAANKDAAGRGVLVVANDWITERRADQDQYDGRAGLSPLSGLIGALAYARGVLPRPDRQNTTAPSSRSTASSAPRVDIVMAYENMDGALVDAAAAAGAKGHCHRGRRQRQSDGGGRSHMAKHAKNGIVCVRSSRVTTGVIGRNVGSMTTSWDLWRRWNTTRRRPSAAAAGLLKRAATRICSACLPSTESVSDNIHHPTEE
jgi:L-asparaginase